MTTTTRRTVLAGAAALPLLPATALAVPVTLPVASYAQPGNATDTSWAAYEAATACYNDDKAARDAVEAVTGIFDGISDEDLDVFCDAISDAESAVLSAKAATLADVERKLAVVSEWNGENDIPVEFVNGILADVRSLMGVAS